MQIHRDNQPPEQEAQPALVMARWNSWVRLYYPATGEMTWVDLREVGFEILESSVESRR
jgi:hypothetical protein